MPFSFNQQKCLLFFIATLLTPPLSAQENLQPKKLYCGENTNPNAIYCPSPKSLKYNPRTQLIESADGWKSTQKTLGAPIEKFSGAQWTGWQTGRVMCVYKTTNPNEFPITLTVGVPIVKPTVEKQANDKDFYQFGSSKWQDKQQSDASSETMLCIAPNGSLCDCPFEVYIKKEETVDQVLNSIKRDPYGQRYFVNPLVD